jgi:hypothetical protein
MRRPVVFAALLLAWSIAPAAAGIVEGHVHRPAEPRRDLLLPDSSLPGPGVGREVRDARKRIERARDSGRISNREARRMRREARAIERLAYVYGRDGLSSSERRELEMRSRALGSMASGTH